MDIVKGVLLPAGRQIHELLCVQTAIWSGSQLPLKHTSEMENTGTTTSFFQNTTVLGGKLHFPSPGDAKGRMAASPVNKIIGQCGRRPG